MVSLPSGRCGCVGITPRGVYFGRKTAFSEWVLCADERAVPSCTQRFFGVPARGRYHYPRCAIHAVETLDARGSRRLICRFYAVSEFAPCGLNLPAAGTHTTQLLTAHTAAYRAKHGAFSPPETSAGSIGSIAWVPCASSLSARRSSISRFPLLRRTTAEIPILLSAATLCRIRRDTFFGVMPSLPAGSIFSNSALAGELISGCRRSNSERKKRIRSVGCSVCSQSSDSSFQT